MDFGWQTFRKNLCAKCRIRFWKTIDLCVLHAITPDNEVNALVWASTMKNDNDEELVFTTYNDSGSPLYVLNFNNIKLLEHYSNFNYQCSDAAFSHIKIAYSNKL